MSKEKKKRNKKVAPSTEFCCPEIQIDDDYDEAVSVECYDCCCAECAEIDLAEYNGKINFSLDNFCCDFNMEKVEKIPRKKKKSKKKERIGASTSSNCVESTSTSQSTDPTPTGLILRPSKPISPKTFNLDPLSDQLKNSNRSFSTNDLPAGFKGSSSLRLKKPKNKSSSKLCNSLRSEPSPGLKSLCSKFKSASLSNLIPISQSDAVKSLLNLSEHDKRILDRMSMKNLKELAQIDKALKARKYWEIEKAERDKVKNEQQQKYLKMVNEKRRREYIELIKRKKVIEEREKDYCERIQNDIEAKTLKAENLLKNIEMEREMIECRKRQRELQKIEQIHANTEESRLDEQIWREQLNGRLEEKIHKAEIIRVKNLDSHRIRVQTDNQIHQQIHAQNYDQTIREEIMKREMLRQRINERDSKFEKFNKQKEQILESSKAQAKTSALLRELVRRSFGSFKAPADPLQRGNENGRFSHCSYTSHVSHIHLN